MITAFITSKNNPKVKIVNGNVKMTNIGFINTLNNPKTTATSNEVVKLFTTTPFINRAITNTKIDVINILKSNFIFFLFQMYKIIILKTNLLFRKRVWGFRREANDQHLESFQFWNLENDFLWFQNLHQEYNSNFRHG